MLLLSILTFAVEFDTYVDVEVVYKVAKVEVRLFVAVSIRYEGRAGIGACVVPNDSCASGKIDVEGFYVLNQY
jgi:hypothetical protein